MEARDKLTVALLLRLGGLALDRLRNVCREYKYGMSESSGEGRSTEGGQRGKATGRSSRLRFPRRTRAENGIKDSKFAASLKVLVIDSVVEVAEVEAMVRLGVAGSRSGSNSQSLMA